MRDGGWPAEGSSHVPRATPPGANGNFEIEKILEAPSQ